MFGSVRSFKFQFRLLESLGFFIGESDWFLMKDVIHLVESMPHCSLFVLDVKLKDAPAFIMSLHLSKQLHPINLYHDPLVRSAHYGGSVRTVKEYIIVSKDLARPEEYQLKGLHVPDLFSYYDLCLVHFACWSCCFFLA